MLGLFRGVRAVWVFRARLGLVFDHFRFKKSIKIQHYFLGSVPLVIAIAFSFFNSSQEARYQPRDNNAIAPNGIAGYAEYINSMRSNEITGLVTEADIQKATDEINALPTNKTNSLTWETKGPDNYGGRTRALLIDKDNSSHLYAGSVLSLIHI